MSYEEIAHALQLSLSNVKVKIHRARLKLSTLLTQGSAAMNISPDVISDLLPLYSPEKRARARARCSEHARAPRLCEGGSPAGRAKHRAPDGAPDRQRGSDLGSQRRRRSERVRRFNRSRRLRSCVVDSQLAVMPLSFAFAEGRVNWMMLRDNPRQALFLWVAALACWSLYYAMGRRLRTPAVIPPPFSK